MEKHPIGPAVDIMSITLLSGEQVLILGKQIVMLHFFKQLPDAAYTRRELNESLSEFHAELLADPSHEIHEIALSVKPGPVGRGEFSRNIRLLCDRKVLHERIIDRHGVAGVFRYRLAHFTNVSYKMYSKPAEQLKRFNLPVSVAKISIQERPLEPVEKARLPRILDCLVTKEKIENTLIPDPKAKKVKEPKQRLPKKELYKPKQEIEPVEEVPLTPEREAKLERLRKSVLAPSKMEMVKKEKPAQNKPVRALTSENTTVVKTTAKKKPKKLTTEMFRAPDASHVVKGSGGYVPSKSVTMSSSTSALTNAEIPIVQIPEEAKEIKPYHQAEMEAIAPHVKNNQKAVRKLKRRYLNANMRAKAVDQAVDPSELSSMIEDFLKKGNKVQVFEQVSEETKALLEVKKILKSA